MLSARGVLSLTGRLEGVDPSLTAQVVVQAEGREPIRALAEQGVPGQPPDIVTWSAQVDLTGVESGLIPVTVMGTVGRVCCSLRCRVMVEAPTEVRIGGTGFLDAPTNNAIVDGDVLLVRGWCLFDHSHVARVEVFVDGVSMGRARTYVDVTIPGSEHKDATVAGFELFVNVRHVRNEATSSLVTVEATSMKGERWAPAAHRVTWGDASVTRSEQRDVVVGRNLVSLAKVASGRSTVVVVTHDLGYGGGQLWLMEILQDLRSMGQECRVVSLADGALRETLEEMGIPVSITAHAPVKSVFGYEGRVHELALLIKALDAGVVLVNTLTAFAAIEAAHRAGVPSFWAIHESIDFHVYCYMAWGREGMDPRVKATIEASFEYPMGLIFEAAKTAEIFEQLRSPGPSYVVDYGVDTGEIDAYRRSVQRPEVRASAGFDEGDQVVLVMGTFEPRKAQAAIVACFDELLGVHEDLHLVLFGENGSHYAEALATQIDRVRCSSRIHVMPVSSNIYPWYELSDLLLSASDMESLPRSILEAMAFELPVVSTDVYGIADLIDDGKTGWLTRDRDLEALTGLLHLVLQKPEGVLKQVATDARTIAYERYGSQSYGKLIAQVLQGVMKDSEFDVGAVLPVFESMRDHA